MVKEKEVIDTSNLHQAGKVQISVSEREVKYNDNEEVIVYKMVEGKRTPTAVMLYTDIASMKELYTQEQIEALACANLLVRCQNVARNWDKEASKAGQVSKALKAKGLSDEQLEKVLAYIEKQ